jgi:endo-1,4-beta-xylanase
MKRNKLTTTGAALLMIIILGCTAIQKPEPGLRDIFKDYFLIGAAINNDQILGKDSMANELLLRHFNALTAENVMKWERIHPLPGEYDFRLPDSLVAMAQRNGMQVTGHTLLWHQQTPKWVFLDAKGNPASRDSLLFRLKDHIFTVVGRYKGKVKGWDVVNEALNEDGSLRQSPWLQIAGEDYIQKAFEYAHEADPDAELYYNDYNIELPQKREGTIRLVQKLQENGVKIDGIGIQGHWHMDVPSLADIDTSISHFSKLGVQVMITELDINVLPRPENMTGADISQNAALAQQLNPYPDELSDSVEVQLARRYADFFGIFAKYNDAVSRVTFWGVHDGQSWLNNWPVRGRTNYPLLFDRNYQPKKAFYEITRAIH